MALGTTAAILLGLGGGIGAGFAANRVMNPRSSGQDQTSPLPMPQAPSVSDSQGKAEDIIKKRRASATQSIYTSPL
mgnify:FL=1